MSFFNLGVIMINNATMEQKLRLIQQVRSRYHENQYDMFNRERILYGKTSVLPQEAGMLPDARQPYPYGDTYGDSLAPAGASPSFFKLRFWAAIFLLAAVIIMDKNNLNVAGITTEKIFQAISVDYDDKIEEWVQALSYNLPQR